jgi:predicted RNase H-like HicB family nuclease
MSTEERLKVLRAAKTNTWIAFSADESRVVAQADTYAEVVDLARAEGEEEPLVEKIPETWLPRVFSPCL